MYTKYYLMGWPFWGKDLSQQKSRGLAELCAENLRQALPDYADFIKVGDKYNTGDAQILYAIDQVFKANYKSWIAEKPVKESKRVKVEIREFGQLLPIEPEKKPIIRNVNLRE